MSEPSYRLTPEQQYSQYYDDWTGHHPEPISPGEAPPADEPTYEQFYPTDPYPPMSEEDERIYSSYYPNLTANPNTEETR